MSSQYVPHLFLTHEQIKAAVARLAVEISKDYSSKNPLLVGILKGSFIFLADLVRLLDFPLEVEFVRVSSYQSSMESSGRVSVILSIRSSLKMRDILVIEDIVDTGLSVSYVMEYLRKKNPASLKLCALLDKPTRRRVPIAIDYVGITVPDKFIVGYGLDFDEKFRNLPDIYSLEEEEKAPTRISFVRRY